MPYAVALYRNRDGQHSYVGGEDFRGAGKRGVIASQSLRAYAESVYGGKNVGFKRSDERIRVRLAARAEQSAFGKHARFIHGSAYAYAEQYRGAGVRSRFAHDIHNGVDDPLSAF